MNEIKVTGLPGNIQPNPMLNEVHNEGVKSTFRNGILYRYPAMVSMLEVQGHTMKWGCNMRYCCMMS